MNEFERWDTGEPVWDTMAEADKPLRPAHGICYCAAGCSRNRAADRGLWPDCGCWCHPTAKKADTK